MVNEELRDMFYIVKGQYEKKKPVVEVGENEYHIGAFDPEDYATKNWYRVIDRETGRCIHAGSSLDRALGSIRREIIRSKTLRGYLTSFSEFSERKNKKMKEMDECIDEEYGYYFRDMIREEEDKAFEFLKDDTDTKKAKRRFKRIKTGVETQSERLIKEEKKDRKEDNIGLVLHKIKSVAKFV